MYFFFFKQKTAYEMRISDWSSDVCSSDLPRSGASPRIVLTRQHDHREGIEQVGEGGGAGLHLRCAQQVDPAAASGHLDAGVVPVVTQAHEQPRPDDYEPVAPEADGVAGLSPGGGHRPGGGATDSARGWAGRRGGRRGGSE